MMLRSMKNVTFGINAAALALIWGVLISGFLAFGKVSLAQVVLTGLFASLVAVVLLTLLVRLGFYLAITIRAYRRGQLPLSADLRRWSIVAMSCLAYIGLGLSVLPFTAIPESIVGLFLGSALIAVLILLFASWVFLESITHSIRHALMLDREEAERE